MQTYSLLERISQTLPSVQGSDTHGLKAAGVKWVTFVNCWSEQISPCFNHCSPSVDLTIQHNLMLLDREK